MLVAQRRLLEIGRLDFARAVMAGTQFVDAPAIDVIGHHRHAGAAKGDGNRQADIAEPDDGDFSRMRHKDPLPGRPQSL